MPQSTAQKVFQYTPLRSASATRLLKILPGQGTSAIEFQINEIDMNDSPCYSALSYVWGNPVRHHLITLNGADLMVTQNLHTALQHLRHKDKHRLFWVDAICINQEDLKERSAQVLRMKDNYEKASEVVIWLGERSDENVLAMSFMRKIWLFWTHSAEVLGKTESAILNPCQSDLAALFDEYEGAADFRPLGSFRHLLLQQWFERVWVIQEATTPLNAKILQCGDVTMGWDALIITAKFVSSLMVRPDLQAYFTAVRPLDNQSLRRLFNMENQRRSPLVVTDLLETLANYRYFRATDPRDKIYALRGMATSLESDELIPDYSLDFQDIYV